MTNPIKKIIILGGSITSSPWYTWKDFAEIETGLPIVDLSSRGVGNEFMVHSLVKNSDQLGPDALVMCMFTNFDKFDWYIENTKFSDLREEKHPPKPISDHSGFWCTGSWFPLDKAVYRDLFYTHDYFCTKTIQQIMLLHNLVQAKNSNLILLFDSPIWTLTEQDINSIKPDNQVEIIASLKKDYLSLPLSHLWRQYLQQPLIDIEDSSLLGYCWKHDLPWHKDSIRGHPPSSSQWKFYQDIVRPAINHYVPTYDVDLTKKIQRFDEKWKEY